MATHVVLDPRGAMNRTKHFREDGSGGGNKAGRRTSEVAVRTPMVRRTVRIKQSLLDRAHFLDDVGGDGSCDVRVAAVQMLWGDIAACDTPAVGLGLRRLLFQVLGIAGGTAGAAAKLSEVPEGWDHETIARVIAAPPATDAHPLDLKCLPPPAPAAFDDALPLLAEDPSITQSIEVGVRQAAGRAARRSGPDRFVLDGLAQAPRSPRTEADEAAEAAALAREEADFAAEQEALADAVNDRVRADLVGARTQVRHRAQARTTAALLARTKAPLP